MASPVANKFAHPQQEEERPSKARRPLSKGHQKRLTAELCKAAALDGSDCEGDPVFLPHSQQEGGDIQPSLQVQISAAEAVMVSSVQSADLCSIQGTRAV